MIVLDTTYLLSLNKLKQTCPLKKVVLGQVYSSRKIVFFYLWKAVVFFQGHSWEGSLSVCSAEGEDEGHLSAILVLAISEWQVSSPMYHHVH